MAPKTSVVFSRQLAFLYGSYSEVWYCSSAEKLHWLAKYLNDFSLSSW